MQPRIHPSILVALHWWVTERWLVHWWVRTAWLDIRSDRIEFWMQFSILRLPSCVLSSRHLSRRVWWTTWLLGIYPGVLRSRVMHIGSWLWCCLVVCNRHRSVILHPFLAQIGLDILPVMLRVWYVPFLGASVGILVRLRVLSLTSSIVVRTLVVSLLRGVSHGPMGDVLVVLTLQAFLWIILRILRTLTVVGVLRYLYWLPVVSTCTLLGLDPVSLSSWIFGMTLCTWHLSWYVGNCCHTRDICNCWTGYSRFSSLSEGCAFWAMAFLKWYRVVLDWRCRIEALLRGHGFLSSMGVSPDWLLHCFAILASRQLPWVHMGASLSVFVVCVFLRILVS